jgi:hypothetical protein
MNHRLMALLLLGTVSACADPKPAPPAPEQPHVSPCRAGVPQPPAPKPPRTMASIVDAYNRAKEAGLATEAALRECAAKVELLQR